MVLYDTVTNMVREDLMSSGIPSGSANLLCQWKMGYNVFFVNMELWYSCTLLPTPNKAQQQRPQYLLSPFVQNFLCHL